MAAILRWLLDSSEFMPRGLCGNWPQELRVAWITANAVIALVYFAIPAILAYAYRMRRNDELTKPWILLCFGSFIFSCGLTHVFEVTVFYWAFYNLYTVAHVITALTSVATLAVLPGVVIHLLKLPPREWLHRLNNDLADSLSREQLLRLDAIAQNEELRQDLLRARHMVSSAPGNGLMQLELDGLCAKLATITQRNRDALAQYNSRP